METADVNAMGKQEVHVQVRMFAGFNLEHRQSSEHTLHSAILRAFHSP